MKQKDIVRRIELEMKPKLSAKEKTELAKLKKEFNKTLKTPKEVVKTSKNIEESLKFLKKLVKTKKTVIKKEVKKKTIKKNKSLKKTKTLVKKNQTPKELVHEIWDETIDGIHLREDAFKNAWASVKGYDEDEDEEGLSAEDKVVDHCNDELRSSIEECLEDEECSHPTILKIKKLSKKKLDDFWQELHDNVYNGVF